MYGMRVHEAVIAAGVPESGATVHVVDEAYDHGAIVLQKSIPVLPGETPESLAARVLEIEHEIYPEALPPRGLRARKYGLELLTRAQPLISALKKIGAEHDGKTPAQVALNWVICKGALPIPGAKTRAGIARPDEVAGISSRGNFLGCLPDFRLGCPPFSTSQACRCGGTGIRTDISRQPVCLVNWHEQLIPLGIFNA